MNRRMEKLIPEDEYGNEPVETRKHVNPEHVRVAIAEVAKVLKRVFGDRA